MEKTVLDEAKIRVLFRPRLKIQRKHICKVGFLKKARLREVLGKAALRKVMRVRVCTSKASEASIGN